MEQKIKDTEDLLKRMYEHLYRIYELGGAEYLSTETELLMSEYEIKYDPKP